MAILYYVFENLNESVQVGDIAYYVPTNSIAGTGFDTATIQGGSGGVNAVTMGTINRIDRNVDSNGLSFGEPDTDVQYSDGTIVTLQPTAPFDKSAIRIDTQVNGVDTYLIDQTPPTINEFIFFQKSNEVNAGSVTGYYAEVKFRNDSRTKAELFTASCEITESSK